MKKFKKLKIELFYLRKMLVRRASPKEFFNYYKNKFFGRALSERMTKFSCGPIDHDFEIHILSQKSMLWPMIVGIRSFLFHSKLCPKIIVHVENEFDQKTIELLESKFDNVKVLPWDEATATINSMTDVPDSLKEYRSTCKNVLLTKLTDGFLLSKGKRLMIIGTDVLFFGNPVEIAEFVKGNSDCDGLASYDKHSLPFNVDQEYMKELQVFEKQLDHLNSDLIIFDKSKIQHNWFLEFFDHITEPDVYWTDLVGFAILFARLNFKFLPHESYKIKGGVDKDTVSKHFTGPRRDELYSIGIDLALKQMGL